jgi:hypothetical protein
MSLFNPTQVATAVEWIDKCIVICHNPVFIGCTLAFYLLVSKQLFAAFRDAIGLHPKSTALKLFVFFHNLALAIFSLLVFVNVAPGSWHYATTNGWKDLHCNPGFWNSPAYMTNTTIGWWFEVFCE